MKTRKLLFLLAFELSIPFLSISQQPDLGGVWMPEKVQWHHAPKSVDPHLSDAQVGLLQFRKDGSFVLLYCTIYKRLESLAVSEGDAWTVYVGSWKLSGADAEVKYHLIYRDIEWSQPGTDPYAEHKGAVKILSGNLILWNGLRFREEPRLQGSFERQTNGFVKPKQ